MARRWHRVFIDALRSRPLVGVYAEVRHQVGRTPTRSELNAGRRAANKLASTGAANLVRVRVAPGPGLRVKAMVVLCRPGAATEEAELLAAAAGTRQYGQSAKRPPVPAKVLTGVVGVVGGAAETARLLDVSRLDAADAQRFMDALEPPMEELARLRRRLKHRATPRSPRRTEPG